MCALGLSQRMRVGPRKALRIEKERRSIPANDEVYSADGARTASLH